MTKKPVLLCIMDGFGWTPDHKEGNAVIAANTPHLDKIFSTLPHDHDRGFRSGRRPAQRPDGQQRGRPHQHGRGPHRLPAAHPHHQEHRGRRDAEKPRAGQEHESRHRRGQGHPPDGSCRHRRRAQPCRPLVRRAGHGQAHGRGQGLPALHHGRPRHRPAFRQGLFGRFAEKARRARHRPDRHGQRPLLRDGPRQELGREEKAYAAFVYNEAAAPRTRRKPSTLLMPRA